MDLSLFTLDRMVPNANPLVISKEYFFFLHNFKYFHIRYLLHVVAFFIREMVGELTSAPYLTEIMSLAKIVFEDITNPKYAPKYFALKEQKKSQTYPLNS